MTSRQATLGEVGHHAPDFVILGYIWRVRFVDCCCARTFVDIILCFSVCFAEFCPSSIALGC